MAGVGSSGNAMGRGKRTSLAPWASSSGEIPPHLSLPPFELRPGDLISTFMKTLGKADLVDVVLNRSSPDFYFCPSEVVQQSTI
jgi:hypothetical protein